MSYSIRRLTLPVVITAVIVISAFFHQAGVRDAVTHQESRDAVLVLPSLYVALSPLSRVLDVMGLLSIPQHIAVALTVIGIALLTPVHRRALAAVIALSFVLLIDGMSAALPRPMAALSVADSNAVRVDFHSHTNFSGDARKSFTVEKNRDWHAAGGFDVAYITDHRSFTGAELARKTNPLRAADKTVLLSSFEGRYMGLFLLFLSLERVDSSALIDRHHWLLPGNLHGGRVPVSIVALPGPLSDVKALARDSAPHIQGIELVDGSPRGFAQRDREEQIILRRADSLGLALVSGSNNHGWGRVVPAWTLVAVPGWRSMSPDSLAARIENELRVSPRTSVRVIERSRPSSRTAVQLTMTVPIIAGQTLAALTNAERAVWVAWLWIPFLLWSLRRKKTRE
ncbi:MAG TPA: hypothetical protein VNC11_16800 [Gemmatimonadaceae bacterium]|jgi:hypothetical protein|nr:hypothetical protein [Gemmatimonadaceae bacterium]